MGERGYGFRSEEQRRRPFPILQHLRLLRGGGSEAGGVCQNIGQTVGDANEGVANRASRKRGAQRTLHYILENADEKAQGKRRTHSGFLL